MKKQKIKSRQLLDALEEESSEAEKSSEVSDVEMSRAAVSLAARIEKKIRDNIDVSHLVIED